jgi:hypothetical protein
MLGLPNESFGHDETPRRIWIGPGRMSAQRIGSADCRLAMFAKISSPCGN